MTHSRRSLVLPILSLALLAAAPTVHARDGRFEGKGEVVTVDPAYGRITIEHSAIKGFAPADESTFSVADKALLKEINRRDLVDFTVVETRGDVKLEKIVKTGVAEPEETAKVGKVVQEVIYGTGQVAKAVTTPVPPAHGVMSGAVDATTGATGAVLENADTRAKSEF